MNPNDPAVRQYLGRHAEHEIAIASHVKRRFGHVLAIPAAGEGASLHDALASIPPGPLGEVLVILVINGSVDAPDWITDANRTMLAQWTAGRALGELGTLHEHPNGALLLIDRASPDRQLPAKQGVGLARKIGADLALALWSVGSIQSPWIHCTDADAVLPHDYFDQPLTTSGEAAALAYRYRHVGADAASADRSISRAALEYEISLRYYVRGLAYAGSPYAFHTIGSTLAVRADAYAKVRGFPRRLAAEDFYLLNKLSKVGRVEQLAGRPIDLSSRVSLRVPFGTGRALADAPRTHSRHLYDPEVFAYLGLWQSVLTQISQSAELTAAEALRSAKFPAGLRPEILETALDAIGAFDRAPVRARNPETRLRQLQHAFDAGRTLKLIHTLRDQAIPSIELEKAVQQAPFVRLPPGFRVPKPDVPFEMTDLELVVGALGRPE